MGPSSVGSSSDRRVSVLGGGTAGLAIASRLATIPNTSVAVIEAGGFYEIDNGNGSVIPALAPLQHVGSLPNDTQPLIDWGFVTVPQAVRHDRSNKKRIAEYSKRERITDGCTMLEVGHSADHRLGIIWLIIGNDPFTMPVGMTSDIEKRNQRLLSAVGGPGWRRQLPLREPSSLL